MFVVKYEKRKKKPLGWSTEAPAVRGLWGLIALLYKPRQHVHKRERERDVRISNLLIQGGKRKKGLFNFYVKTIPQTARAGIFFSFLLLNCARIFRLVFALLAGPSSARARYQPDARCLSAATAVPYCVIFSGSQKGRKEFFVETKKKNQEKEQKICFSLGN